MDTLGIRDVVINEDGIIISHEEDYGKVVGIIDGMTKNILGNTIFKSMERNKLLLQGANLFLEKMAGKRSTFQPQTLNSILGINDTAPDNSNLSAEQFMGFVIGLSNNNGMYGDKPAVNEADRNLYVLLPFRMTDAPLTSPDKDKYLLYKDDSAGATGKHIYYGKRFESGPDVKVVYEDGSEVPIDVANPAQKILKYIEWTIKIDIDDLEEYFTINPDSIGRRVTSIGLITGFPSGAYEVHHTQLATKANIDMLPLAEKGSHTTLRYRVYLV